MAVKINGSTGITFEDNDKENWGTGNDLEIYHDGSHSKIQSSTGALLIDSDNLQLRDKTNTKIYLHGEAGGKVELRYDNNTKFETTASGIAMAGVENAGAQIKVGIGNDIQIEHDGSNSYLTNSTGTLGIQSDTLHLQSKTSGEYFFKAVKDGAVELYHDNTKQCETSADGLAFPSGKGINFNATADASGTGITAGSETFDDYEEGVWAAQVNTGVSNTQTFDQTASYIKIGKMVHCQFLLQWSGAGDGNHISFTGLPFTSVNNSSRGGGSVLWTNVPSLLDYDSISIVVNGNDTDILLYGNVTDQAVTSSSFSNKALYGVFTYEAA